MKSPTIPLICGAALAVMTAASLSHWWSVKNFVAAVDHGLPISANLQASGIAPVPANVAPAAIPQTSEPVKPAAKPIQQAEQAVASRSVPKPHSASSSGEEGSKKEFYETLISKLNTLENQNQDLRDQMAETNRDMMKMQFQIDTHSEDFRPMPVSEERPDTSFGTGPGVLPPRAEPVIDFPFDE